jgi:hypothetical protein
MTKVGSTAIVSYFTQIAASQSFIACVPARVAPADPGNRP